MTGNEFKAKREMLGWTQKEAAQGLGVTIAQISGIENGRSNVTKTMAILFDLYEFPERPGGLPALLDVGRQASGYPQRSLLEFMK